MYLYVRPAIGFTCADTMADMNFPANDAPAEQAPAIAPPIRTDDQILPLRNWVPVGKSNYVLDVLKPQKSPIFKFWDTMRYDYTTGIYNYQLDEQWFNLHKDILRDALQITPINDNDLFVTPPSSDTVIEYVNALGYPCMPKNVSAMSVNSLYQPWRAILSMINMCLTSKTAGHDRPRHPMLQILWEYIDGFTWSIRKDGREIFGMAILDALLTDATKRALYYGEYLEHVANYQQYLDEERGKAEEEAVTESPNATKVTKPKAAKQTKPSAPKATKVTKPADDKAPKPTSSQPPKPKPAPTKPSKAVPKKTRRLVKETPNEPSLAKRSKGGLVGKRRKPKSPLKLVDEFVDEGVTYKEPSYDDEEANLQRALELSLKDQGEHTQRPARLVVFREPDSGRFQPLPERRTSMSTEPFGNAKSPSLDAELALIDSETESDKEVPPVNPEKDASYKELTEINTRELSFTNQFFVEKLREEEPKKTNSKSEVQSMVTVPIYQDTSSVPPMTTPVIDLTLSQPVSTTVHAPLATSTTTTSITSTITLPPPPPQPQQSTTDPILLRRISELEQHMADLLQKKLSAGGKIGQTWVSAVQIGESQYSPAARFSDLPTIDMKEILQQRMFEDNSYKAHEVHENLFEALEKSLECDYSNQLLADVDETRKKKIKRHNSPRTPFESPPSQLPPHLLQQARLVLQALQEHQDILSCPHLLLLLHLLVHQDLLSNEAVELQVPGVSAAPESSPIDSLMNDDSIPDEQVQLSDDEDTRNDHLPKADKRKNWWKPLPEEERPATPEPAWTIPSSNIDMTTFMNWYCRKVNKTVLTQADFKGQAYKVVKAFYPDVIHLHRPLPLGGPPGHVTIQTQFFFNKDLEYLLYGNKGSRPALLISKMKAARYPDFGLELLVPEQMWIDDVCTYDKSARIWYFLLWLNRHKFYIDRHDSLSRRREVRTHIRILSVVRIKAYSRYGYDYLSEIVLRRADFQEHTIDEKDFKNLYPNDFEDLNLLLLQGYLDHLPSSDTRIYQKQLNLTKPGWDPKGFEFKHDYATIESPRAVVFPVDNNKRKIMRFNEIYKFSDGTLTHILEALDYRVKEFKLKRLNSGMNTRFWTQKDVTKSNEFISAIERRLKTRRIYQNLECFVGGRVLDTDYRLLQRTE
ncbi:retrovirus-related pol polyprotein from transposon TNT 1-94 [Tanacetum coccineum]